MEGNSSAKQRDTVPLPPPPPVDQTFVGSNGHAKEPTSMPDRYFYMQSDDAQSVPDVSKQVVNSCNSPRRRISLTRHERKEMKSAEAKALASQRAKEMHARMKNVKQAQRQQLLQEEAEKKQQAVRRATFLFLHDPATDSLIKNIESDFLLGESSNAATAKDIYNSDPETDTTHNEIALQKEQTCDELLDSPEVDKQQNDNMCVRQVQPSAETLQRASKLRMDLQQLRGIFAATDANNDGLLSEAELRDSLVSLGFQPSDEIVEMYRPRLSKGGETKQVKKSSIDSSKESTSGQNSPSNKKRSGISARVPFQVDMHGFLRNANLLDDAQDCIEDILPVFELLDPTGSGVVTRAQFQHLLEGIVTPSSLSREEAKDFMSLVENVEDGNGYPVMEDNMNVRYETLLESLIFI